MTHNNTNGIMSTYNEEELFEISRNNRSELAYNEFISKLVTQNGNKLGIGSIILLKVNKDFSLKNSENVNVRNSFRLDVKVKNPETNIYADNSNDIDGFNLDGNKNITSFAVHFVPIYRGILTIDPKDHKVDTHYTFEKFKNKTVTKNIQYTEL